MLILHLWYLGEKRLEIEDVVLNLMRSLSVIGTVNIDSVIKGQGKPLYYKYM